MWGMFAIFIVLAGIVLATWLIPKKPVVKAAPQPSTRQHNALEQIDHFVSLFAVLQRYRALQGEQDDGITLLASPLAESAAQIERIFSLSLQRLLLIPDTASLKISSQEVRLLRYQWQLAISTGSIASTEQRFLQLTNLIETVLTWIRELGKKELMLFDPSREIALTEKNLVLDTHTIKLFTAVLPELAEVLARLRRLGMLLCVATQLDIGKRAQMIHLIRDAEKQRQRALAISVATNMNPVHEAGLYAQQAINTFLTNLRDDLLLDTTPKISPQSIFTIGSHAVDAVFAWIRVVRRCSFD